MHERSRPGRPPAFDIFCRVVDNFGDAGVCWRLARQLAGEQGAAVTLWIDRPDTLRAIAPDAHAGRTAHGVAIRCWSDAPGDDPSRFEAADRTAFPSGSTSDGRVFVSAFGCALPDAIRNRIVTASRGPGERCLWVNLEYLSAEDWVEGCHGLASTKPQDGAVEHFFYPGFTASTGGLLREHELIATRKAFVASNQGPQWLAAHGLGPAAGERRLTLFCYADAPVRALLDALAAGQRPTRLYVPEGVADAALAQFLGHPLPAGAQAIVGRLTLQRFALLAQDDFDRLLWSCDLNFVRGEDSWVRAQWAGHPFIWQPYPQTDGVDATKLMAFLDRFERWTGPQPEVRAMMQAWHSGEGVAGAWNDFAARLDTLAPAYARWSQRLAAQPDLASSLLEFCTNRL